ncbi:MAG: RDD family protein [Gammaproteobacteria bacterium]|nr:RDD family protein [Gammaproteobacteria bacterium]MDH5650640.1 RDD family protein [Gammaproteobacteria bacterium]
MNSSNESTENLASADNSVLAGRWARLLASLIDALTMIPFSIALLYFTGGFATISEGKVLSYAYALTISLISIAIFFAIHGKFIIRDGQTLGKKALNIKIVKIDGQHADITTLAKRYGFYWLNPQIPVIGPLVNLVNLLFIFTSSKRCLHDHVGGTKVIFAD